MRHFHTPAAWIRRIANGRAESISFLLILLVLIVCPTEELTRAGAGEYRVGPNDYRRNLELSCHEADVQGPPLKMEHGALGHWNSTETTLCWELTVAEDCQVGVTVLAAVEKSYEGSRFEITVSGETLSGELLSTGGWFDFKSISVGSLWVPKGKVKVTLAATNLPRGAFGNFRSIRLTGVALEPPVVEPPQDLSGPIQVYTTAEVDGTRISQRNSLHFEPAAVSDRCYVALDPEIRFQKIEGFGGAFTESTAHVFAQLSPETQRQFLEAYFDKELGHGYRLCRTHINSCDFSLGSYSYDDVEGDFALENFTVDHDREFLIPLIKEAQEVAGDQQIKLLASPWSPPAWMKTNGEMLHGGKLKPECRDVWARYISRYIKEYRKEGIDIWAVSVQNEPLATQTWESCLYSHEEERDYVRDHLGPTLEREGLAGVKIVVWDHNRDLLFHRSQTIFDDPEAAKYVWGAGFHWYVTDDFENVQMVHDFYPDKQLLFTEGCLEQGAHLGDWSAGERYARSVINDLNHWAVGWIDWNLMLDTQGGPNHVGNFCSAPIIGDIENDELILNSSYYYLGHFSRFIPPGSVRILCKNTGEELLTTAFLTPAKQVAVVLLNQQDYPVSYSLLIHGKQAAGVCVEHSIATLLLDLGALDSVD